MKPTYSEKAVRYALNVCEKTPYGNTTAEHAAWWEALAGAWSQWVSIMHEGHGMAAHAYYMAAAKYELLGDQKNAEDCRLRAQAITRRRYRLEQEKLAAQ